MPLCRWCSPKCAAMRLASVPLPDAAGPSIAMIMGALRGSDPSPPAPLVLRNDLCEGSDPRSVSSAHDLRRCEGRAESLHQPSELREAGGDGIGVIDGDGPVGAEAQREEG